MKDNFILIEDINLEELTSSGYDVHEAFVAKTRGIFLDNELVGLIDFNLSADGQSMYIGMIEIFNKGNGIGSRFIKWIFKNYPNLEEVFGDIMIDWDLKAYGFWKSLGAYIELNEEEALEQIDGVNFYLNRKDLIGT